MIEWIIGYNTNLHETISVNLYRSSNFKEVEYSSLFLKYGLGIVIFFQKAWKWGKRGTLWKENSDKHYLSQVVKLTSTVISVLRACSLDIKWWGSSWPLWSVSTKPMTCLIMRETPSKSQYGIASKDLPSPPPQGHRHRNKGSVENCTSPEKPEQTWWPHVMWCPG